MIDIPNFDFNYTREEIDRSSRIGGRLKDGNVFMTVGSAALHHSLRGVREFAANLNLEFQSFPVFDEPNSLVGAVVRMSAKLAFSDEFHQEELRGKELASVDVAFAVEGILTEDFPTAAEREEHLRCFSLIGAPITAWPMLREAVMTFSSKLGLQPIMLPFIKLNVQEPASKG